MAGKKWTPAQRLRFNNTMKQRKLAKLKHTIENGDKKSLDQLITEAQKEANSWTPGTRHAPAQAPLDAVAYIHGEIRERLRNFAERIDVPVGPLTQRVGELLLGKTRKIPRA